MAAHKANEAGEELSQTDEAPLDQAPAFWASLNPIGDDNIAAGIKAK